MTEKIREVPENFDKQIAKAIRFWAKNHPEPDSIALEGGEKSYTPREIAYNVTKRTKFGRLQLRVIHYAVETQEDETPEKAIQRWYPSEETSDINHDVSKP